MQNPWEHIHPDRVALPAVLLRAISFLLLLFCHHTAGRQRANYIVCLSVCLLQYHPENYTPPPVLGSKPPGSGQWSQTGRGTNHVRTKASGTYNLCLTLYKWMGWLTSLDTTKTTSVASSATEQRPPMPCLTYWFWTGG